MSPKKPRLSRGDIGTWVFKGNPDDTWDYFASVEDEGRLPGTMEPGGWTIGSGYRTLLIEPGDLMVLWITGQHNPGIYEIGKITESPIDDNTINEEYLINKELAGKTTYSVQYNSVFLSQWVRRSVMKQDHVLSRCEQFVIPIIGNPTYLTPEQRDALLHYIPQDERKLAGWPTRKARERT